MTVIETARRIVRDHQAEEVQGVLLDAFTASMLVQVHDALNETNQRKLEKRLEADVVKGVDLCWKLVKRAEERGAA